MSVAVVLDTDAIIYYINNVAELLSNIVRYVRYRVERLMPSMLVPGADVFIPEAVQLELLLVSGWERFMCENCGAEFRVFLRIGGRYERPRYCPLCGSNRIRSRGTIVTRDEVNNAINGFKDYLTGQLSSQRQIRPIEVRLGEPRISDVFQEVWRALTQARDLMRCRGTLDFLITESACYLLRLGNYQYVDLLTSDEDSNNCIRSYKRFRGCNIKLFNYKLFQELK